MHSVGDLVQYPAEDDGRIRFKSYGILLGTYMWKGSLWAKVYISGSFHKYPMYQLKR